ncbi:Prolyl 3-hydroxylase ogfod1 [Saguinus oedipus]|uniref:Prolyl 3-hydroxylase ogfod1 n=1 Tax=Saguinus oedipus TaxID=9490 RepID=A0ABQ9UCE0_SAGOE|nr:Prolyl 3-hydroxylase ogfod1 [Saguinus oedipus]
MNIDPFLHWIIPNFIQSQDFLEGLQKELMNLDFHEKYNGLYKFQHCDDLKKRREPHISALRKILSEDFWSWLSNISKIDLELTNNMSYTKYEFTEALLCHADKVEGCWITFILYLFPSWDRSLGGTRDLYHIDEQFQLKQIVKSSIPSWNKLVFFEAFQCPFTRFEPLIPQIPHIPQDYEIVFDWINATYLDMNYQVQIQGEFEESSEILLKEFLKSEKFAKVCEALENRDVERGS